MINLFNRYIWVNLFFLLVLTISCQEEFEEVSTIDEEVSLIKTSNVAQLIVQVSANDGSFDNIVDGSSCISVKFPYSVQVNSEQLTISTFEDLQLIENVFDALSTDQDTLSIDYPISIISADYSQTIINNDSELAEAKSICVENGADSDIECVDFVYPLSIFKYDVLAQETRNITIQSDRELNLFLYDLGEDEIISLNFPVYLNLHDGTINLISNNIELEEIIETAKDSCDEDDDNDYNDDDFEKEALDEYVMSCPMLVDELFRDDEVPGAFIGSLLVFSENDEVILLTDDETIAIGSWTTIDTDEGVVLTLEFDESYDAFNSGWLVYDLENGKLSFYNDENNNIILEKDCSALASPTTIPEVQTVLLANDWVITSFYDSDNDYLSEIEIYSFDFIDLESMNTTATDSLDYEGTWRVFNDGTLHIELNLAGFFENLLNLDWQIVTIDENKVELINENIDPDRVLIFEKKI